MKTNNTKTEQKLSVIQLIAQGRFAEVEKLCINHPSLRQVLLQWRGVRHTAFFKKRLKFYKNFAKKSGLRKFTPEVKNQMREQFAREHCLKTSLKRAYTEIRQDACTEPTIIGYLRRRRKGRLGLF